MARKKNTKTGKDFASGRKPDDGITTQRARGKAATGARSLDHLKPRKFKRYLTITELALFVPTDVSWIRKLEREDRIPKAQRVPMGSLEIRLWSPEQAEEIKQIIEGHHVGRPKQSK